MLAEVVGSVIETFVGELIWTVAESAEKIRSYPKRARAARSRGTASAPSHANTSKIGGETAVPVSATRRGWA